MNLLVTGSTGYLGSAVAAAARDRGYDVLGLSRRAEGPGQIAGDATVARFGLSPTAFAALADSVTHVAVCHGSVDWSSSPSEALAVHDTGTVRLLRTLEELPRLERMVHVSSLLALGRAQGLVGNAQLFVGQTFRNWYEYGKYCAEHQVRNSGLPAHVVRLGPLLGTPVGGVRLDTRFGVLAALPWLLGGGVVHLDRLGDFPCYVSDLRSAAEVVVESLDVAGGRRTMSWFDPRGVTLANLFRELCRPWGVSPRIVDLPPLGLLARWGGHRVGLPRELADYAEPWFDLAPGVLDELPFPRPAGEPDYLAATGRHLREQGLQLGARR